MKIGYARVSKGDDQSDHMQVQALKRAGCTRIYREVASGDSADRPELAKALASLKPKDVLLVWKVDRFSRSLLDLLTKAKQIEERGAAFRSLTEPFDTRTDIGRAMMQIGGIFAELEVKRLRERTRYGLAAARAAGRPGGRRRKLSPAQEVVAVKMVLDQSNSIAFVAGIFKVSTPTMNRILARHRREGSKNDGAEAEKKKQ